MTCEIKKQTIVISNIKLYCEYCLNGKPPILLLHGFVSSTYTFNRLIPLLANHFSVVAIDLPGFGRSEKSLSFVYSFKNYAKIVAKCIDYFNFQRATIVGHSMGGQIALYTARLYPDKVDKLILLCSSGYLKRAQRFLIYGTYLPFSGFIMEQYIRRKDVMKSIANVFYNKSLITDELMKEFTRPLQDKKFYRSLLRLLRYREGDLSSEELKSIDIPALLIWGKDDQVVPLSIGKKLVSDLPKAELITYDNTGHLVTEERSMDVFNQIVSYTM